MPASRSSSPGAVPEVRRAALAAVAGLAAALAPATLTGHPAIDAVERALLVAFASFVGAHGKRMAWIIAAALVVVPARGSALVLVILALVVLVASAGPRRRSKDLGVIGLGLLFNAPLWYRGTSAVGVLLAATAALVVLVSGTRNQRSHRRRALKITCSVAAVAVVLAGLGVGVALLQARGHTAKGTTAAKGALQAARDGDAEQARLLIGTAAREFDAADGQVGGWLTAPARAVPVLAQQLEAIRTAVRAGAEVSTAGDDVVATADYDELQYAGRLDLEQVRALAGPTRRANEVLLDSSRHLDRSGGAWLLPPISSRLDQLRTTLASARRDIDLAADLLQVSPDLLGADGDRRYLVVFITPAELRGAGGFIGSFAEITAREGKLSLSRSGRIRELIDAAEPGARTITGPPDYLARYGRFDPADYLQDVTFSPDFPSDAQVLAELYPQSGGQPVDGVISVDPSGLAALLELTGPVVVPGFDESLTADRAVDILTTEQYLAIPDDDQREEFLTQAVKRTFEALTSGTLPAPRRLADVLSPAARGGHLRMWSPEADEQALFERLGADGSLHVPEGDDGFSVVQQNMGNDKLDAYLQRTVDYAATVDARTGALRATLTIELRNDVPSLDLPPSVLGTGGRGPVGTNIAALSVFTPSVVQAAEVDGKAVTLAPSEERGLYAWDLPVIRIPPGGSVRVVLELEGAVDLSDGYDLRILPQPVANADRFSATLAVDGGTAGEVGASQVELFDDDPLGRPTDSHTRVRR